MGAPGKYTAEGHGPGTGWVPPEVPEQGIGMWQRGDRSGINAITAFTIIVYTTVCIAYEALSSMSEQSTSSLLSLNLYCLVDVKHMVCAQ